MQEQTKGPTTLTPPVDESRDHIIGKNRTTAYLTLVEYGDYECSYCGQAYYIVKELLTKWGDQLRFVFRNFPLTEVHPHAEMMALAAEVAGSQGEFWRMHDYLFEHQKNFSVEDLHNFVRKLNLDPTDFERAMTAEPYHNRIRGDIEGGLKSGVQGTPTFFINGIICQDWHEEALEAALQATLNSPRSPRS